MLKVGPSVAWRGERCPSPRHELAAPSAWGTPLWLVFGREFRILPGSLVFQSFFIAAINYTENFITITLFIFFFFYITIQSNKHSKSQGSNAL